MKIIYFHEFDLCYTGRNIFNPVTSINKNSSGICIMMEISHYEFEYGKYGETTGITINLRGYDILRFNNISKGTAFTP